jgi:hypothetical protein
MQPHSDCSETIREMLVVPGNQLIIPVHIPDDGILHQFHLGFAASTALVQRDQFSLFGVKVLVLHDYPLMKPAST